MKPAVIFVILQTGSQANGGLRSISSVIRHLKHHRPIVLTNLESGFSQSWREAGHEVHIVPEQASTGFRRNPARTIETYRRYHRALSGLRRSSGARVIHANDPLSFQLSVAAAKLSRTPIVLNLRDTLDPDRKPPRLKFRLIFGSADHVFYLSADMARRWRQVAPNAMRSCSITYSIVEPERFAALRPSAHEPPVVLVPGIFSPKKGQLEFIRNVVAALAREGIETWFAGDFAPETNPYAAACAEAARPFDGSVKFLGYRDDMSELYGQADVVAVPSKHEGLMRGMIEAMSCARPVVSFDLCSARELLEAEPGRAGVVLPMGDYDGMADALVRLAADQDAQAAAGLAGSTAARRLFDPERVVDAYERVYSALGRH